MSIRKLLSAIFAASSILLACNKKQPVASSDSPVFYLDLADSTGYYSTASMNKVALLGRVLFYDSRLSINNAVACASCHKQQFAFADNVALSRGFENKLTERNSMPIENLPQTSVGNALNPNFSSLFWDGRETNVKNLIKRPLTNHVEMGITDLKILEEKIAATDYYPSLFTNAYGDDNITSERIAEAISIFICSIRSEKTRLDLTRNKNQLNALETQGEQLFNTKYDCNSCHNVNPGSYLSFDFVNIGLDATSKDLGRGTIDGNPNSNGEFRTPNLRNVAVTAPYMHDGRFNTLDEVIEHYSHGIKDVPNLDFRLKDKKTGKAMQMNISEQEKKALIAFLNTLTDYEMLSDPKYSNPFKIK